MKLIIEKSVVVITPTVGNPSLLKAVNSVRNQTYKNIKHLIVSDGPDFFDKVHSLLSDIPQDKITITTAPINTGANGMYGHRIYASYPHLVNEEYVLFLDEDNWWDENHVQSLVSLIEENHLDWAHSLRKVYVADQYLDDDCCECIGRYPIWFSTPETKQFLVDTSSYCFKRTSLINICQLWHWGWGGDRRFFMIIKDNPALPYNTTGLHTLNYNLPDMNKAYGGDMEFFKKGNEVIKKLYGGKYPWQK
jgi:GT2 family glycosyltransferase